MQLFLSVEMQKERGGGAGTGGKEADARRFVIIAVIVINVIIAIIVIIVIIVTIVIIVIHIIFRHPPGLMKIVKSSSHQSIPHILT